MSAGSQDEIYRGDRVSLQGEGGTDSLGRGKSVGKGRRELQGGDAKQGCEGTMLMCGKRLQAV